MLKEINFTDKFNDDSLANSQPKALNLYSGNSLKIENLPSWLPKSNFSRNNSDLIATSDNGDQVILIDYFSNFELPSLLTENGLLLNGSLVRSLAGPLAKGQYAQAADGNILSIGEVSTVSGTAKATRLDGTTTNLNAGDPVFQGDTIETEGSGAVGLVFLDKTTLSLSDGGKMVLDELVYDATTGTGSMAVDMLEGAFSFVSGEIAKTGPDAMSVKTPVAVIGIRGTTVAGKAAVEGNQNSFTLLQDADGGVGQIAVSNDGGTQVLAQVGATTSISSFTAPPPPPVILTTAQIQANYGTALNVLPPTPAVAPQPQAAPPPQEQAQEEQAQEEEAAEEEGEEEAGEEQVTEEGPAEEGEGEEGPPEGEEGPPVGPDGEPLAEGEGPPEGEEGGPPEGEEGPPVGPDGEVLAEGEGGPPIGPDGEPLPPGEGGPPLGPDGEPLPPGEGGPPIGPDGEPLGPGEGGPPLGPDGEPLPSGEGGPGDFGPGGSADFSGPGGPSPEQEEVAREAFETALADGLSPEQAMAAAAEAAGLPSPPGGFGPGGPGGPGNFGPGGPGDFGPGGPGDFGDPFGGPGGFDDPFAGPGGPGGFGDPFGGPGGAGGPGDPFGDPGGFGDPFGGPGGPGGPGDPFGGPGGPVGFGGPGGPGDFGPGGPGGFGGPGDFGTGGPSGMVPGQFMGAQPPGAATFSPVGAFGSPIGGFTSGPIGGFGPDPYAGPMGGPMGGHMGGPGGFGDPLGGPMGGPGGFGPDPYGGPGGFGPDPFGGPMGGPGGPGGFGPDPFGGPMMGGSENYVEPMNYFFDDPSLYMGFFEPELFEEEEEENGGGGSGSGSGNTITGTNNDDSEDKSTSSDAWRFDGFSGNDSFKGGSGNDTFFGGLGADDLTGNGGSDTYYFSDFLEGADTIRTFSAADTLKFGYNFTNNYSRSVTFESDNGANGSVYNINASSGNLPIVFNFTANNANHTASAGVSNFLSNFRITTDGSTDISTVEDALIVTGNSGNTSIWGWENSGTNGTVEQTELVRLATLNSYDNDSMTAANVAFGNL
ncbi:MAG: hypothetical protein CMM92_00380 [Rickettsiales bacterium]|nr:hypothetical protein [Rickettsiales bacterium]RPG16181.1 MAG: hypothetical protein CBD55_000380 [Pelagibacteraceae bacterium TMED195]|tara:strand:+ start:1712 stop:4831 length:3120 start_codon:yes stop_codon:yes gene_type:complete